MSEYNTNKIIVEKVRRVSWKCKGASVEIIKKGGPR